MVQSRPPRSTAARSTDWGGPHMSVRQLVLWAQSIMAEQAKDNAQQSENTSTTHTHTKHLTQIYATLHILKFLPMSISHMQPETWLVPTKLQARGYKKQINFYTNSPSLISLMVSVDVKHHDYLLTWTASIMSYFPMSSHNYKLTPFFIKYNLLCRGFIFSSAVFKIVYYAGKFWGLQSTIYNLICRGLLLF